MVNRTRNTYNNKLLKRDFYYIFKSTNSRVINLKIKVYYYYLCVHYTNALKYVAKTFDNRTKYIIPK